MNKTEIQIGFVPSGDSNIASIRMRFFWVTKYWPEAHIVESTDQQAHYDVLVYRTVWKHEKEMLSQARKARRLGKKIIWDLCDPDWWYAPHEYALIAREADAIVCPTIALAEDFSAAFPHCHTQVIPDRFDPEFHPTIKQHADVQSPVLIWFGAAQNRVSLYGALPVLERLWVNGRRFEFVILDEKPEDRMNWYSFPIVHRRWSLDRFHADLLSADIAILPPYPGPIGSLKSNNKKIESWWAGLPVVDGHEYHHLGELVDSANSRQRNGLEGRQIAEDLYDIRQSVREWQSLIELLTRE